MVAFMMPKKYLVTGGCGFLGSALVRRLVREGHTVRVLDNQWRSRRAGRFNFDTEMYDWVVADICDATAVRAAMRGMDAVCHLAFINGTEFFYKQPELVLNVGVRGMLNVLDACSANDVGELLLVSSSEVYQTPPVVPTPEDVPLSIPDVLNPRYSYAGAKIISELMVLNWARAGHLERAVVVRPHNVYGPNMGWEHVLPQFALRMGKLAERYGRTANGVPFIVQGDGAQTRAFVNINDFTDGLMLVLEKGAHIGIYNIGTQDEVSIADVARLVARCNGGLRIDVIAGAPAMGGTLRRCPDIGKLAALGYRPKVRLEDGVKELVRWYGANAHLAPREGS